MSPEQQRRPESESAGGFAAEVGGELPLLELFYRLRERELPLGIAEYELLPMALMAGFGFDEDKPVEALKRLCRMLWVKTPDEEITFEHVFAQYLKERPLRKKAPETESEPKPVLDDVTAGAGQETGKTDEGRPPLPPTREPAAEKPPIDEPPAGLDTRSGPLDTDVARPKTGPALSDEEIAAREQKVKQTMARPDVRRAEGRTFDEADRFVGAGSAQAGLGSGERRYRFKADYLPITKRQMKQSWRYLRKPVREGPPVEFDVEATVDKVAVEGRLFEPVMVPRRVNRAAMVLLVDQEGSMTPFHGFSRRLEETAVRGGRLGQTNAYFFHDYPLDVLYCNRFFGESRPLETVLGELHPTRTAVLVFSDAGAARDRYSYERVEMTRAFLRRVNQSVRYVAWLNPIPAYRWANTSAAAIARSVPMFEISREGLQNAISVLRGRSVGRR